MKAAASWSGGKDSCLACYKALEQGYEVTHLVNFISSESRTVSAHGVSGYLIRRQAEAVGITLVQYTVIAEGNSYEQRLKRAMLALISKGVEGMVFGDIYLQEHRDWIERVCSEMGITPVLPLWEVEPRQVLRELITAGFESIVVSARANIFGHEWLGRRLDHDFLYDLSRLCQENDVDICGEHGEYHTLVVDGPSFRQRLQVAQGAREQRDGYWFLNITRSSIVAKG